MTIDIPVFAEDGSVSYTQTLNPEEAQHLLQFALNFLTAAGMSQRFVIRDNAEEDMGNYNFSEEPND